MTTYKDVKRFEKQNPGKTIILKLGSGEKVIYDPRFNEGGKVGFRYSKRSKDGFFVPPELIEEYRIK